jgi:hypothetical protein
MGGFVKFERKKAENCFADAENYEYRIDRTGDTFVQALDSLAANVRINGKLRRPSFLAVLADGVRVKGVLAKNVIKVGFVPADADAQRANFERWLGDL